jgi:hypothetical protein
VFGTDMAMEFPVTSAATAAQRPTEKQGPSRPMQRVRNILHGFEARGVDRRHVSETEHHDGRQFMCVDDEVRQFVGGAEQKRPVNPEDRT